MLRITKPLALVGLLFASPAWAGWGTPTVVANNAVNGVHSCGAGGTVAQGSLMIMAGGGITNANADAMLVTDNAGTGNVWTVYYNYRSTLTTVVYIAWAYNTGAFAGKTVLVSDTATGGTTFGHAACSLISVTGEATSAEDTTVRGTNFGTATTTPTVTSGSATYAGDLYLVSYGSANNITNAYTEDGTWTNLVLKNGDTATTNSIAYLINSGKGTKTHVPTTTSQPYVQEIMGFALPPAGGLTLLGVS